MKKALSMLLVVCLMLSLSVSVFAATMTPVTDKTTIAAGEDVTVTLTLDEAIPDVTTISWVLRYDSDLFTLKSSTPSFGVTVSNPMKDTTGSFYRVTFLDTTSKGVTIPAGTYATLVFTAKEDITENVDSSFSLTFRNGQDVDGQNIKHTAGEAAKITVTPKADPAYTLTMADDKTAKVGEEVSVGVTVGYTTADVTSFNTADMTFTYDTTKLEYVSASDIFHYTVSAKDGTIRVISYGEAKDLGEVFTLTFKVTGAATEGTLVTATSAKIDSAGNSGSSDAPEAKLIKASTKITTNAVYNVTLPDFFTGDSTVEGGSDYTFKAADTEHYTYSDVTATVGGETVTVKDNGDGTYTIENVTGDVVVTGTRKGAEYTVTVSGNAASKVQYAATATYGTEYTLTAANLDTDSYDYTMTVTVNGKSYTPELKQETTTYTYTIPAADVAGPINAVFTMTEKVAATTQISFSGTGASDVVGGTPQTATNGKDFTFEINKDSSYDYTVKLNGETLTAGTDGKYTIPGASINGTALTVTVEKTTSTGIVSVQKYVNLDGTSMWLISVSGTPDSGKVYTYGGQPMYQSSKYADNGSYVYLVIAETLTQEDAAKNVAVAAGVSAGTVDYSGDVNGSKKTDINDAQLVYDMYNARYADFTTVTMYKFLCADVSDSTPDGTTLLNVNDAVCIVNLLK